MDQHYNTRNLTLSDKINHQEEKIEKARIEFFERWKENIPKEFQNSFANSCYVMIQKIQDASTEIGELLRAEKIANLLEISL